MITLRVKDGQIQRCAHLCLTRGDKRRIQIVWEDGNGCSINRPWESVIFGASKTNDYSGSLLVVCDEWSDGVNEFDELCSRGTLKLSDKELRKLIGNAKELKLAAELQLENDATGERTTSHIECFHVRNDVIKDEGGDDEPSSGRVGEVVWILGENAPEHCRVMDGSWLPIEEYGKLYSTRAAGMWTTKIVDSKMCFQLPDMVQNGKTYGGLFVRATNDNRVAGSTQEDAMQPIRGKLVGVLADSNLGYLCEESLQYDDPGWHGSTKDDDSNAARVSVVLDSTKTKGVRTADENRPVNVALLPVIFYR